MVVINCSCGCKSSSDDHKMIDCSVCKNMYIHSCVDLSVSELRTIKTKKGLSWSCRNCNVLSNDINELRAAILSMRNDFLANRNVSVDDATFELILAELDERNKRKQNIILFNVDEINANATEKANHDLDMTRNILGALNANISMDHLEVHRLGRLNSNSNSERHRPLKVVLGSVGDVHRVLKTAKRLGDSSVYRGVRISTDRTRRQLDYYKKVKAEMDSRIANGATNLKIKYQQGVPTIVSLN